MNQKEINDAEWRDPANWRGGWLGLYFGRRDTRILVPKRRPIFGFTVNLARREGKALLLGILGAIVTVILAMSGCSGERPEAFYANYDAVVKSGAIERGWVPAWIPKGVRNVRELHDPDANEGIQRFEVFGEPNWIPPSECQVIPYQDIVAPRFSRPWWPYATDQENGYDFYECPDDTQPIEQRLWVGRAHSGKAGLFWSTPK